MYIAITNAVGRMNSENCMAYMQEMRCWAGRFKAVQTHSETRPIQTVEKVSAMLAPLEPCLRALDSSLRTMQTGLQQLERSPEFQAANAKLKAMQRGFQQTLQSSEFQSTIRGMIACLAQYGELVRRITESEEFSSAASFMSVMAKNVARIACMPEIQVWGSLTGSDNHSNSPTNYLEHGQIAGRTTETKITTPLNTSAQEEKYATGLDAIFSADSIREALSQELRRGRDRCTEILSRGQASAYSFFSSLTIFCVDRQLSIHAHFMPACVLALLEIPSFISQIKETTREFIDDLGRMCILDACCSRYLKLKDNQL